MEQIKNTVINVIQALETKKASGCNNDPERLLKKALTKNELKHIKVNHFKKGVLSVYVDSSSWLYSLTLRKDELLRKLNKRPCEVKDVRFRIGDIN